VALFWNHRRSSIHDFSAFRRLGRDWRPSIQDLDAPRGFSPYVSLRPVRLAYPYLQKTIFVPHQLGTEVLSVQIAVMMFMAPLRVLFSEAVNVWVPLVLGLGAGFSRRTSQDVAFAEKF